MAASRLSLAMLVSLVAATGCGGGGDDVPVAGGPQTGEAPSGAPAT